MLRKNKCFLEGVSLVESQIIIGDAQEDQKHRRRIPQPSHNAELTQRKSYNYHAAHDAYQPINASTKEMNLNLPIRGRQSIIDPTPTTFTPRTDVIRSTKLRVPTQSHREATPRLYEAPTASCSLRQVEIELLNDYRHKGSGNAYNIFDEEEALLQKLPKCETCSTNLDNVIRTYICLKEGCERGYEFVCPGCQPRGFHKNHKIFPAFSVLYYFQKQANDPASLIQLGELSAIISQIETALKQLHAQTKRLNELKCELEERANRYKQQQQNGVYRTISKQLQKLINNIQDYSEYEFQSELRRVLHRTNINNLITKRRSPEIQSQFFPKLNQMVRALTQPLLPFDQHLAQPVLLQAIAPLKNYFVGEEIELLTSSKVSLRELGKVRLICDGDTHVNIEKVREAAVSFRGRRMDREIRTVIECLQRWALRRNRFRGFDFTLDYKLNAHPTTENSPLLSELMKVPTNSLRITLYNIKNNEAICNEFNQVFAPFRQVKELFLNILLNHLHSQAPIFLERPDNIVQFSKSLGHRLMRLTIRAPISVAEEHQEAFLRELSNKPHLLHLAVKFDSQFTPANQMLYGRLLRFCQLRLQTVYKLHRLASLKQRFGNGHYEMLELLI